MSHCLMCIQQQNDFSKDRVWIKEIFQEIFLGKGPILYGKYIKFLHDSGLITIKNTYNVCAFLVPNLSIDISILYVGYTYFHFPNSVTLRFSERFKI